MNATITSTTDGRFIGGRLAFALTDLSVTLPDGRSVRVDRILQTPEGFTLAGSNYILTATPESPHA